jgi:hypothetical protein
MDHQIVSGQFQEPYQNEQFLVTAGKTAISAWSAAGFLPPN